MAPQDQIERTRTALNELFRVWDNRADLYGRVLYSTAIAKNAEGAWRNVMSFLLPLHKGEQRTTDVEADYGHFKVVQGTLAIAESKAALSEVIEKGELRLPKLPPISIKAFLYPESSKHFWRSATRRFPLFFPYLEFSFSIEQNFKEKPPQQPLWATDLPLYPSGVEAIEDLLLARLGDANAYDGVVMALAPDYRGKIHEVRLSETYVSVQIMCYPVMCYPAHGREWPPHIPAPAPKSAKREFSINTS